MKLIKQLIFVYLFGLLYIQNIFAQKINVIEENNTANNKYVSGYSVTIDLNASDVKKSWNKQLKTYGKTVKEGNNISVINANVPSFPTGGTNLYSTTSDSPRGLKIWFCITTPEKWNSSDKITSESQAKTILHDFAATSYRDNINEQIKDAERALMNASKNQEKVLRNNEKIKNQILDNATEKIELEKKLKQNAADLIQFNKDLEQNKIDQQKAQEEVERMKKATEIVKSKLNEIN